MKDTKTFLDEMEEMRRLFHNCKAYFPYMGEDAVGKSVLHTAPYYMKKGFPISFHFDKEIACEDRERNNGISRWINENFIVRLYALLEYYGVMSGIDQALDGWIEVDLLRRLRMILAHTTGKYNPEDKEQNLLMDKLIYFFKPDLEDPKEFPLDIDKVIDPLFEGCRRHIKAKAWSGKE